MYLPHTFSVKSLDFLFRLVFVFVLVLFQFFPFLNIVDEFLEETPLSNNLVCGKS